MSTLKILVTGCKGRMGQAVSQCATDDAATEIGAGIDMGDSLTDALAKCDAVEGSYKPEHYLY